MGLTMIVLAAGMGSRFGGPKQLIPIGPNDECILDYNTHDAAKAGFDRIVVVTRPELETDVRGVVDRGVGRIADVRLVFQLIPPPRSKPLGTADAVATASAEVDGSFGVANADDLYGPRSFAVLHDHLASHPGVGANVGFRLDDTVPAEGSVSRGRLETSADGFIKRVIETHGIHRTPIGGWSPEGLTADTLVSMNLWGFPHRTFADLAAARDRFVADGADGEIYLPTEAEALVTAGSLTLALLSSAERWAGLTNPDDIDGVRSYAAARTPPGGLWS